MTNPTVISEQPETIDNNQIAYNSNFNYVFAHNLQGHSDKVWSVAIERIVGGSIVCSPLKIESSERTAPLFCFW